MPPYRPGRRVLSDCDQYANDNNWLAHYHTTGPEILEQTGGRITHFVTGIGTGGTPVGRRLKEEIPGVEIVQIVPEDFPGIEGLKPLESPGGIIPKILDRSDWSTPGPAGDDSARKCALMARDGLFGGQSSGASTCKASTKRPVRIGWASSSRSSTTSANDMSTAPGALKVSPETGFNITHHRAGHSGPDVFA